MSSTTALATTILLTAMLTPSLMAQTGPAVELSSFNADYEANQIEIRWQTVSKANTIGFIISRSDNDTANFSMIASHLSEPDLAGNSTTTDNSYRYIDAKDLAPGHTYHYRLQDVAPNGTIGEHAYIATVTVPALTLSPATSAGYQVGQNIPNPAHSITRIPVGAPSAGTIRITVFDDRGQKLGSHKVKVSEGMNTIDLDVSALKTGRYLYQIEADTTTLSRVMTVVH
jgi:hypothetical protein